MIQVIGHNKRSISRHDDEKKEREDSCYVDDDERSTAIPIPLFHNFPSYFIPIEVLYYD